MQEQITHYNRSLQDEDITICILLQTIINKYLPEAESKIWHRHPVWFIEGNPIVGYSKLKAGIRLMFWSGASFGEEKLKIGTGKFQDASIFYTKKAEVSESDMERWIKKARDIQWDYKNIVKRKGELIRLK